MKHLSAWLRGNWAIPTFAAVLIITSFAIERLANVTLVSPLWLGSFTLADLAMLTAAILTSYGIVVKAVRALTSRVISIDLLVSIAAIGAALIGNYWEAAAVTLLFTIGHALEAATLDKTRSALTELVATAPDTAIVMRNGEQVKVHATDVHRGENVLVKNGAKVPVDGIVISGNAPIDEASITGESIPVEKSADDQVYAGTISRGGLLTVEATGVGADTTLAQIIHRVEEAQDAKAPAQTFIDRFSRWYTPAVIALALVTGLVTQDIVLALTLLVIACPGALVISIPVAIVAGIGQAARNGILIKGGEYLETSAKISVVALDKTGTLTEGRPQLTDIITLEPSLTENDVLRWAAAAEAGSEHPLAQPVLTAAGPASPDRVPENVKPIPGKGICSEVSGTRVLMGTPALLAEHGIPTVQAEHALAGLAPNKTAMIVAIDDTAIGIIAVADRIREDAPAMVESLHKAGIHDVVMLTGDTPAVAETVAAQTGIDQVHASLLPEDKLDAIAALQREGRTVAMVGDGVNDAPALATANIGIAMGAAGSAVAIETADIALISDNLLRLPDAILLAKRTVSVIRQNVAISVITVALLVAGVFAGGVTMSLGMLVHEMSVLIVILNAMRLLAKGSVGLRE